MNHNVKFTYMVRLCPRTRNSFACESSSLERLSLVAALFDVASVASRYTSGLGTAGMASFVAKALDLRKQTK
jgi:hypothetical protein